MTVSVCVISLPRLLAHALLHSIGSSGDSVAATKSTQTSSSASEPVNKRIGAGEFMRGVRPRAAVLMLALLTAAVQSPVKRRKTFQPSNAAQEQPCAVSLGTLPADVVLEIGSHLDLRSLWNLHRISKPLHAVFASKHSRKIWAQAMKSIDLPEVAMAAPLLAQLLLDQGCMVSSRLPLGNRRHSRALLGLRKEECQRLGAQR